MTVICLRYSCVRQEISTNLHYAFCLHSVEAKLTNGVTAILITAPDGELLGVRVEWSIKPEYLGCLFITLRVELNHGQVGRDISVDDRTSDFNNDQLNCNTQYTPRLRAVITESQIDKTVSGDPLLYRGKL